MKQLLRIQCVVVCLALGLTGCGWSAIPEAAPDKSSTATAAPTQAESTPAAAPAAATATTSAPAAAIKLSAGVALAQTGVDGTLMSFSVDYRFTQGTPNRASKYLWVLQPTNGSPLEQPVRLSQNSTLQALVPQLRPENGPFTSHIAEVSSDGTRRMLSQSIPMR